MNPIHPGTVLAACLDQSLARDDAIRTVAQQIDVPSNVLADIIAGKEAITKDLALRLNLIIPHNQPEMWLQLQFAYDLYQLEHNTQWREQLRHDYDTRSAALSLIDAAASWVREERKAHQRARKVRIKRVHPAQKHKA